MPVTADHKSRLSNVVPYATFAIACHDGSYHGNLMERLSIRVETKSKLKRSLPLVINPGDALVFFYTRSVRSIDAEAKTRVSLCQ